MTVRAICSSPLATGDEVMLTTRPERLRFTDQVIGPDSPQNRMSVTVMETVFAGELCRYLLQAADGTSMVLKEPSSAARRRRAVGERVDVSWSVADTILL
jgi:ABC-type Fe3+/spermidine/putrescine transport system ATPase subunit